MIKIISLFLVSAFLAALFFFIWETLKGPELVFSNTELEQGDTLLIRLNGTWRAPVEAQLGSKPVSFFRQGLGYLAVAGIDANAKSEKISFYAKLPFGKELRRELTILPCLFNVTEFIVPKKLAEQGVSAASIIKSVELNDRPVLDSIFKIFTSEIGFSEPFGEPLKDWIDVGNFGTLRQSDDGGARHLGVDLKADLGEPVYSVNTGTVKFAGELKNYGKTVIIDHGMGIFSGYLHLSEVKANLNSKVKKGEIIGLAGSTGEYSLVPHLHFTLKIRGASVDPKKFLETVNQFLK
jgi:murein DD-endopeptidase MepM/ murein hydrolase activator NlpD